MAELEIPDYIRWTIIGVALIVCGLLTYNLAGDINPAPCDPQGYPGRCYTIDKQMCEKIWTRSSVDCDDFVRSLSLGTRLTGPIKFKCQLTSLDKLFHFGLRSTDECLKMHADLKEWQRRNDFK